MKAKAAAEIFNRLEMPVLIRVVERMHEAKSADVLARMDPVKAKQVTTELARRSKLLEAASPGPRAPRRPRTVVNRSLIIGP
jgi:flagellar motility protein MotE (MotC chaperone)